MARSTEKTSTFQVKPTPEQKTKSAPASGDPLKYDPLRFFSKIVEFFWGQVRRQRNQWMVWSGGLAVFAWGGATFVGGVPASRVWEISLEANVRCKNGRVRLPKRCSILAARPHFEGGTAPEWVRFDVTPRDYKVEWKNGEELWIMPRSHEAIQDSLGRVATAEDKAMDPSLRQALQQTLKWNLGSVQWSKVRCEAESGRIPVTVPLWVDPQNKVRLESQLGFTCERVWESQNSGQAQSKDVWIRLSDDSLTWIDGHQYFTLRQKNVNEFKSYSDCRF